MTIKNQLFLNLIIAVFTISSCGLVSEEPQSKEEALSWVNNTLWEETTDLADMNIREANGDRVNSASTFYFFSDDGYCYISAEKMKSKSTQGLPYKIKFEKGDPHNVVQVCISGCENPHTFYLSSKNEIIYIQFPSMETSKLKKIE